MTDSHSHADLVILRRYRDLPDAELAKGFLESAGIECVLRDDVTIGMNWGWSFALGGIKVCVRGVDAYAAAQVLDQAIPESFEVEGVGKYNQPRCPNCDSVDISVEGMNAPRAGLLGGLSLGMPVPIHSKRYWKCGSCGHAWPESEISESDA